jgi:hypothetical protein
MAFLQHMLDGIAANNYIPEYGVMENYDPDDQNVNTEIFDRTLDKYLQEYLKAGIEPVRYSDADAFISAYLENAGC